MSFKILLLLYNIITIGWKVKVCMWLEFTSSPPSHIQPLMCVKKRVLCHTLTPTPTWPHTKPGLSPHLHSSGLFWLVLVNNNWSMGKILNWPEVTSGFYLHERTKNLDSEWGWGRREASNPPAAPNPLTLPITFLYNCEHFANYWWLPPQGGGKTGFV